jgi:hypothetical protein
MKLAAIKSTPTNRRVNRVKGADRLNNQKGMRDNNDIMCILPESQALLDKGWMLDALGNWKRRVP